MRNRKTVLLFLYLHNRNKLPFVENKYSHFYSPIVHSGGMMEMKALTILYVLLMGKLSGYIYSCLK